MLPDGGFGMDSAVTAKPSAALFQNAIPKNAMFLTGAVRHPSASCSAAPQPICNGHPRGLQPIAKQEFEMEPVIGLVPFGSIGHHSQIALNKEVAMISRTSTTGWLCRANRHYSSRFFQ